MGSVIANELKSIYSVVDLTLLQEDATEEALLAIKAQANQHQVAAICVYPKDLPYMQAENTIDLATVINFPHGTDTIEQCITQIKNSVAFNTKEIDYVFPYQDYLNGQKKQALHHCQQIIECCKQYRLKSKIIMESGAFPNMSTLYQAASDVAQLGCDFLKTSTGKIAQGASLDALATFTSAIQDTHSPCGIKVSGGIKTISQAQEFCDLAERLFQKPIDPTWFRIGTSRVW